MQHRRVAWLVSLTLVAVGGAPVDARVGEFDTYADSLRIGKDS